MENTNEELKITKAQTFNSKLFPFYKAISWDLLFYYAIYFLYLTTVKGLSPSTAILADSFYPIFKFILQLPITSIIEKIGKRKGLIIGNIFVIFSILTMIYANNFWIIVFSNLLSAIGFNFKAITEPNLLYDSIPRSSKRSDIFSKIDGKGSAFYYYIDAISAISTGFLFTINGYLPMYICLFICIISTFLSCLFKDIPGKTTPTVDKKTTIKTSFINLKHAFRLMISSKRLRCLLAFSALVYSLFALISTTLMSSMLQELELPIQYFGIVTFAMQLISGFGSLNAQNFHKKYKNTTLRKIGLTTSIAMFFIGLPVILKLPTSLCLEFAIVLFILISYLKGPFHTLIRRYLNNFTTSQVRTKITAANDFLISITRSLLSLFTSILLSLTSTAYCYLILGCIYTLILVLLLDYMRDKVGLKPEEYDKKEIEFIV